MAKKRKTLGVGVIGTGWVAGAHIDAFEQIDRCKVLAVCSRKQAKAEAKIAAHGLTEAAAYEDLDAFLAHDGLDIVVVATAHPFHPEQTIAAAKAGKHIVIEKPAALTRPDLRKMVKAVNDNNVLTSVCFELRWIGSVVNAKEAIDSGLIGRPYYGESAYFHGIGPTYKQWAWNIKQEFGGDALLTAGCHALDTLIWLMGDRVAEVAAMSNTSPDNPFQYEYDPNSVVLLQFEGGAMGKVATSIECRQPYTLPVMVQGDKGTIHDTKVSSTQWPRLKGWAQLPASTPESGDVEDHPFRDQFEYFVECIRKNKRPHNDLNNTAHTHEVMFAADEAIKRRRTVKVQATPGAK